MVTLLFIKQYVYNNSTIRVVFVITGDHLHRGVQGYQYLITLLGLIQVGVDKLSVFMTSKDGLNHYLHM